ncbi:MAG: hypothetical protein JWP76_3556 [Dactylosporangium sp.]|jgi:hypothetical protein|nr:hypothetical protein [Dactylosporangium sp.]
MEHTQLGCLLQAREREVAVRFEVSQVMDTIERRLTTDIVMAQAVVDLGEIIRCTDLDDGRPVNLIRVGMVVDAFGRYLRDGGAMIYPVAPRELLSEAALTAKERMVLGRWTGDGLIEATQGAAERVLEIAELTGLPVISLRGHADVAKPHDWLRDAPLRVLTVSPRGGGALLTDGKGGTGGVVLSRPGGKTGAPAGKAEGGAKTEAAAKTETAEKAATVEAGAKCEAPGGGGAKTGTNGHLIVAGDAVPAGAVALRRPVDEGVRIWPDPTEPVYEPLPEPPDYLPASSSTGTALIARAWRCDGLDCPSFGEDRRLGQPVPRLRGGKPVCPRHDEPLRDIGARPPAVPVTLIVDGLRRRHFVVMVDRPMFVGRAPEEPDGIAVGEWLHEAASRWISRTHLKLEIRDDRLVATDVSKNGTLVWVRSEPGDRPDTFRLTRGRSYPLGEWDSVEMYTGIELCRADRRPRGVDESHDEPSSVLTDAPTFAMRQLPANG